jgi:hypothetical protein
MRTLCLKQLSFEGLLIWLEQTAKCCRSRTAATTPAFQVISRCVILSSLRSAESAVPRWSPSPLSVVFRLHMLLVFVSTSFQIDWPLRGPLLLPRSRLRAGWWDRAILEQETNGRLRTSHQEEARNTTQQHPDETTSKLSVPHTLRTPERSARSGGIQNSLTARFSGRCAMLTTVTSDVFLSSRCSSSLVVLPPPLPSSSLAPASSRLLSMSSTAELRTPTTQQQQQPPQRRLALPSTVDARHTRWVPGLPPDRW